MSDFDLGDRVPTSSVVVARARGTKPDGVPAKHASTCTCCGLPIRVGELMVPAKFNAGFTDELSLAARGSGAICGFCETLLGSKGLMETGYGVFSAEGVRPFRKWADVAHSLLEPPEPPFVMVYATAKNQHMAWRTDVSFSRQMYCVRVGLRDLWIRRPILAPAVEACRVVATAPGMGWEESKAKNRKTLPNPFSVLSNDLKEVGHASFNRRIFSDEFRARATNEQKQALDLLRSLSTGETWALRFILTPDAGRDTTTESTTTNQEA